MPRSCSPARKRQRLSSPTYDDQVEDFTAEDFAALDAFEAQLTQGKSQAQWGSSQPQPQPQDSDGPPSFSGFAFVKASGLPDDPDNPFSDNHKTSAFKAPTKASIPNAPIAFASASKIRSDLLDQGRSPSPEAEPEELDFDSWFKPTSAVAAPVFTTPKFSMGTAMMGFSKASNKGIIMPSAAALAKAKAKLDAWSKDFPDDGEPEALVSPGVPAPYAHIGFKTTTGILLSESPSRAAFQPVSNTVNSPATPPFVSFSRPSISQSSTSHTTPKTMHKAQQFKAPLLKQPYTSSPSSTKSPLNPQRRMTSSGFSSAASHYPHPLAAPPITAFSPSVPSAHATPLRAKAISQKPRMTPAPFKTPFKAGFRPSLATPLKAKTPQILKPAPATVVKDVIPHPPVTKQFFCLTSQQERKTLASSKLRPQQYSAHEIEGLGINISMLNQITPATAMYYTFRTASSTPRPVTASSPKVSLGPIEAFEELIQRGCTLATQEWVDNHWGLILWKLAGMVALDPYTETSLTEKRWCWSEVMRQLLYRYERELNGGNRPPFQKLANQDAPAAFPMVLCVSNILYPPQKEDKKQKDEEEEEEEEGENKKDKKVDAKKEEGKEGKGSTVQTVPRPMLEVTDGWYRLRAEIDEPMARAVRRGIIRIGRKLGVAGARLSTQKKDPSEILDAYNSTHLVLTGNSSHLMPWHTKLGFTRGPCISTLHSLTADGGVVAVMDFVIIKAHDIAFLEFVEDEYGRKERVGPRGQAEELEVNEKWKKRYENEASKLRAEYEKKQSQYVGYADRLERKAGNQLQAIKGSDGYPPENIDSLYDELEYPDTAAKVISRISSNEAGWLALHIHRQIEKEREYSGEEIQKELQSICPPRNVRSFRILIIQDTCTNRRPSHRTAQLTVWDVLNISLDEGSRAGGFNVGQRFMATNLVPQSQSAWMDCGPGSEVYLATRRDTRWTQIKKLPVVDP